MSERLYQLAGIAAAIGTLLEAPFTAALFAAERVYADRIVYRLLAYCLFAGVIGYTFNNHLLGLGGLFQAPEHARMFVWQECLLVFLDAVGFSAPAAIALGPTFRAADWFFAKIPAGPRFIMERPLFLLRPPRVITLEDCSWMLTSHQDDPETFVR